MLPRHWDLKLVDLNVEDLKETDLRWSDFVMISAMIVHKESVTEIIRRCKCAWQSDHRWRTLVYDGARKFS